MNNTLLECQRCKNTGIIKIPDSMYIDGYHEELCGCQYNLDDIGIPENFKDVSIDKYKNKILAKRVNEYIKDFQIENRKLQKGICFYGVPGSGKTFLTCAILISLKNTKGIKCKFITISDLLTIGRQELIIDKNISEINKIKNIELLVLDNLGTEKVTEWVEEFLSAFIDYRYRNCLTTLYTTDYLLKDLITRFSSFIIGERIVSRIKQSCYIANTGDINFRLLKNGEL
ncbi:MAG TPA: ATP-binding protein [Candidatus Diapherotrites archaeon]|nr:ATP-binding protein [Candidatus Diapherotrites archaeon]